jgi:hypothetical protein
MDLDVLVLEQLAILPALMISIPTDIATAISKTYHVYNLFDNTGDIRVFLPLVITGP